MLSCVSFIVLKTTYMYNIYLCTEIKLLLMTFINQYLMQLIVFCLHVCFGYNSREVIYEDLRVRRLTVQQWQKEMHFVTGYSNVVL